MDVQVVSGGDSFLLSDLNVTVRDFIVGSIEQEVTQWTTTGRVGYVDLGSEFKSRVIQVVVYFKSTDMGSYPIVRDKIYEKLLTGNPYYIRELRRKHEDVGDDVQATGKQYYVRLSNISEPEQNRMYGFFTMEFTTYELPFAESIYSTDAIGNVPVKHYESLGMLPESESRLYEFNAPSFRVYNAGNVAVHPFFQELEITIEGATGSDVTLTNTTTGEVFRYIKTADNRKIVIDGPRVSIDGVSVFRDTNRRYVTLAPGWNNFTVSNGASVKFKFKYYYK